MLTLKKEYFYVFFTVLLSCQALRPKKKLLVEEPSQTAAVIAPVKEDANIEKEIDRNCVILDSGADFEPEIVETRSGFVAVTRVLKPCSGTRSKKGYSRDTTFTVLGVPCTGGGGAIERMRPVYAPKRVEFLMSIGCPMKPSSLVNLSQQSSCSSAFCLKLRLWPTILWLLPIGRFRN